MVVRSGMYGEEKDSGRRTRDSGLGTRDSGLGVGGGEVLDDGRWTIEGGLPVVGAHRARHGDTGTRIVGGG